MRCLSYLVRLYSVELNLNAFCKSSSSLSSVAVARSVTSFWRCTSERLCFPKYSTTAASSVLCYVAFSPCFPYCCASNPLCVVPVGCLTSHKGVRWTPLPTSRSYHFLRHIFGSSSCPLKLLIVLVIVEAHVRLESPVAAPLTLFPQTLGHDSLRHRGLQH